MLYRSVQAIIGFALRLFFRVRVQRHPTLCDGPTIFVGNHPNGLLDPALIFVTIDRPLTFLAKEPLFRMPVLGSLLRGLGALPVYRKQDHPTQMDRNQATFDAAAQALGEGCAITLFPEGKSHSEPGLAELKTGCARIALQAARAGAPIRIVPVGLTYAEKHRFRSEVLIDCGEPIEVGAPEHGEDDAERVRRLTNLISEGLRKVVLNLEAWEDLPILQTAEALHALRQGLRPGDISRARQFAEGMQVLRAEQPERFERLRGEVAAFRRRLQLVHAQPEDLALQYRRTEVYPFIFRNLASLLFGFPLFALGVALFFVPFLVPKALARALRASWDVEGTVKFAAALVVAPLWWGLLTLAAWWWGGAGAGLAAFIAVPPLALFTRYFFERRRAALADAITFLVLGSRASLKARLLVEGEQIATEVEQLATELGPRLTTASAPS